MFNIREYSKLLIQDAASRRQILLTLSFCLALVLEVWLLYLDFPEHKKFVLHLAVSIAVILLPFTMAAIAARFPSGQRLVKPRFIVRPFRTLTSNSAYDGRAIASLMHREIVSWQVAGKGKLEGQGDSYSIPTTNVELGGASLPLEWLWTLIRFLFTGKRDVTIEGLMVDSEEKRQLRVWTTDSQTTWTEDLPNGYFSDALDGAIAKLAPRLLESLDPVLLARINYDRWNYDEAIRLMLTENAWQNHQLEIASISLDGEYLAVAERQLEQVERRARLSHDDRTELGLLRGNLFMRLGKFDDARKSLRTALQNRKCPRGKVHLIRTMVADSFAYEDRYKEAIEEYESAQREALAELCRVTGERSLKNVRELLNRRFYGKVRQEAVSALWALSNIFTNRSRCRKRTGEDPLEDLRDAHTIVEVVRALGISAPHQCDYREALALADLARCYFEQADADSFFRSIDEATELFDSAIQTFETIFRLNEEQQDLIVDLAWSYYSKGSCLLAQFRAGAGLDTENALDFAAERVNGLFVKLSGASKESISKMYSRTRRSAQDKSEKYAAELGQLTTCFVEVLLQELVPDTLTEVLGGLGKASPEDATPERSDTSLALSELCAAEEKRSPNSGLDADEIWKLYAALKQLWHTLASHPVPEEVDNLLVKAALRTDTEHCLNQCDELFRRMTFVASKRMKAEGNYGLACLAAIQDDGERAGAYLQAAGSAADEGTVAYLNRAHLDNDFDGVRSDEKFYSLISGERAAIPSKGLAASLVS